MRNACLTLAKTHFEQFVEDGKFIGSLSVEDFQEILSNPWLCVSDEKWIFRAIATWLSHQTEELVRENCSPLMMLLNPLKLSMEFLEAEMATHPMNEKSVAFR